VWVVGPVSTHTLRGLTACHHDGGPSITLLASSSQGGNRRRIAKSLVRLTAACMPHQFASVLDVYVPDLTAPDEPRKGRVKAPVRPRGPRTLAAAARAGFRLSPGARRAASRRQQSASSQSFKILSRSPLSRPRQTHPKKVAAEGSKQLGEKDLDSWYRYGDSNPGPVAENHVS
jgi:hypothetical protein